MKKSIFFLTTLGALAFSQTIAQTNEPAVTTIGNTRITWGIRAGVDWNNINGKYSDGSKMKNDLLTGFHAGFNAELPLASEFYLQPGVMYRARGSKLEKKATGNTYDTEVHLSVIEIPVNFLYKPVLGTGHLLLGAGPYVDFGIGGKMKYSGSGAPGDRDIKFQSSVSSGDNSNYAYFRGFGAGGNLLFGYEFANRLSLQLNAQLGLTDINPDYESNLDMEKATTTGFGVSAGFRF